MRFFNGPQIKGKDERVRWALMSSFDIPCEGRLYLRRLRIVQTPWFGVYLHEMHGPDADRDLHDHPYNFYTFILKGGYLEEWKEHGSLGSMHSYGFYWPHRSGHFIHRNNAHRITHLLKVPTYTLVFVGRRVRDWGFWIEDDPGRTHKFVPWDKYHEIAGGEKAV